MMLLSDPVIAELPFEENGDPILDVREVPGLRLDDRLADAEGAFAGLRSGTLERLLKAQTALPDDLRLLIVEGYRPLSLQHRYFSEYKDELHG